jgi:hypothetical protein
VLIRLSLFLFICASCSNGQEDPSDGSVSQTLDASENSPSESALNDLFHNEMRFTRDDLMNGATNCSDILDEDHIEDHILSWPPELRSYFLDVLSEFPGLELISNSVHGIYLVTDESLQDPINNTTAAGLACDRGSDFKGIIFLNYNSMVKKRLEKGIGTWQESRTKSHKFVNVNQGDGAAITLLHEIFHAIDIKMFMHGNAENFARRTDLKNKSWVGNVPKFKRGNIFALSDDNQDNLAEDRRCTHPEHTGLGLTTNVDAKSLASELIYLQEQTNFLVPYTMASPAEDFAETLTVYYFGIYYQSWQKRTVSVEKKPLFVHDTELILRTKKQHIEKTCAAAELVFGNCRLRK